jgi:stage IV sporulation protein A
VNDIKSSCNVPVIAMDCARASEIEITNMMMQILGSFPVREIKFRVPGYIEGLESSHWLKVMLADRIISWAQRFKCMEDVRACINELSDGQNIEHVEIRSIDMGTGVIEVALEMEEYLYYQVVGEIMGDEVQSDYEFFSLLKEFSEAKKAYDKLKGAIQQVEINDYGIVQPKLSEMTLTEPEVFKEGGKYGVKMVAKAPTLHIIKTDITTEIAPLVGSEKQAEDLAATLKKEMEESDEAIWQTNIFGKTMYEMVSEQMQNKITSVPDNVRTKMQKSLQKISDEGKEYFICIVI